MNYKLLLLDTHAKNLYPLGDDFSGKSPQEIGRASCRDRVYEAV